MGGEYPVYSVRQELGAQLLGFHASIHEQYLCRGVPGEEIMRKRTDIDKEHVRGKPIGALTRDHVIVSILSKTSIMALYIFEVVRLSWPPH